MANEKDNHKIFTADEADKLTKALDQAIASHKRTQNTRPEFKEIAKKLEDDLNIVKLKIRSLS